MRVSQSRFGIARTVIAVIVVVIIIIAGAGVYLSSVKSTTTTTTSISTSSVISSSSSSAFTATSTSSSQPSTKSSSSFTSSSPSSITSSSTSSSNSSSAQHSLLTIEDYQWPSDDFNMLYAPEELPYPGWLTYSVYQPLVTVNESAEYNLGNIQFLPGLAQNWTVSSNGTIYTFNLRQNVTFSNGDPFNAYQVWMEMYGFYYLTDYSSNWLVNYNVFNMSNVTFGPSTITQINQSGGVINPDAEAASIMQNSSWPIYATGPYQIVYHLKSAFNWFPGIFVVYVGLMFDTQWVMDNGGFGTPAAYNSYFNQHPIPGTGPYVVKQVVENSYVSLAQNPTYWGRDLTPEQLAMQPVFDPGQAQNVIVYNKPADLDRYTDLSTGAAQIAAIQAADWNLVVNNSQYGYVKLPAWAGNAEFLALNTNLYPTNITLVRQAISHAINFTNIYQQAFLGYMSPYVGPEYPAWSQFYDLGNFPPYQYNLTLAQQLLNEANISSMPTFSFTIFSGCTACTTTAEIVQSDLSQIGITVNIEDLSSSNYYSAYGNTTFNQQNAATIGQLSLINGGSSWAPGTLTPLDFWLTFVSCTSVWGNWAGYCSPTVQNAINAFTSTTNQTYIQQLTEKAQAQIYNDTPYVWIGIVTLWEPTAGSIVWNKNVISGFLSDPVWTGETTIPLINTVTFVQ